MIELAQMVCANEVAVIAMLNETKGEKVSRSGVGADGRTMIVTENLETGTWTILIRIDNGLVCFVNLGKEWKDHKNDRKVQGPSKAA